MLDEGFQKGRLRGLLFGNNHVFFANTSLISNIKNYKPWKSATRNSIKSSQVHIFSYTSSYIPSMVTASGFMTFLTKPVKIVKLTYLPDLPT